MSLTMQELRKYKAELESENWDLKKENERLQSEKDAFRNINESLTSNFQTLDDLYTSQSRFVSDLIEDNEELSIQNAELIAENEVLQNKVTDLENHNSELESEINELLRCGDDRVGNLEAENSDLRDRFDKSVEYQCILFDQNKSLKFEIEELQTQLHQYQVLFADIERNMTVSLYESLLGIADNRR